MNPDNNPINPNPAPAAPVSEPIQVPEPDLTVSPAPNFADIEQSLAQEAAPVVDTTPDNPAIPAAPAAPEAASPSYVFGPENPDPIANTPQPVASAPVSEPISTEPEVVDSDPAISEPIRPAAPVPGSIGSAVSGPLDGISDAEAMVNEAPVPTGSLVDTPDAATAMPGTAVGTKVRPAGKRGPRTIIVVLFVLIVLVATFLALYLLGVFDGLLNSLAKNNTSNDTPAPTTPSVTYTKLVCEKEVTNTSELVSLGNAQSAKYTYSVDFADGELTDLSYEYAGEYEDSTMAKAAINNLRSEYVTAFKALGFSTDPFSSNYDTAQGGITRTASADTLTAENAELMDIALTGTKLVTTSEVLTANYKTTGFTCTEE